MPITSAFDVQRSLESISTDVTVPRNFVAVGGARDSPPPLKLAKNVPLKQPVIHPSPLLSATCVGVSTKKRAAIRDTPEDTGVANEVNLTDRRPLTLTLSWIDDYNSFPNRREIQHRINDILLARLDRTSLPSNLMSSASKRKFAKRWSVAIETCLYKNSADLEEYIDISTLDRRVTAVAVAVARRGLRDLSNHRCDRCR